MYISPLSPVLKESLYSSSPDYVNHLHTTDSSTLKLYFGEYLMNNLINRQKTLVVIPDSMDSSVPAKLLSSHKLAHLTMSFDKTETLSDKEVERLQMLYKLSTINHQPGLYKSKKQRVEELQARITDLLSIITEDSDHGPSLKELTLTNIEDPNVSIRREIIDKLSSMSIDEESLRNINKLHKLYKPAYAFIDTAASLNREEFVDDQSKKLALEEVYQLKNALSVALSDLDKELELAYETLQDSIEKEARVWKEVKKELELAVYNNELDDSAKPFEEAYQEIMPPAKKLFYLRLDLERKPELNWGEAQIILQGINGLLENCAAAISSNYKSLLKRMTPFNIAKPEMRDILDRSQSIIRAINKCRYLTIHTPTLFLQVDELKLQLRKAATELNLCYQALRDDAYCAYLTLINRVQLEDDVLQELIDVHAVPWSNIVQFQARQFQISSNYTSDIKTIPDLYQQIQEAQIGLSQSAADEIHNIWCKERDKAITNIKNYHWDIYKAIWSETDKALSKLDLFTTLSTDFTSFCPVIVTHESDLDATLKTIGEDINNVFFLDIREMNKRSVQLCKDRNMKIAVATSYDIDTKDVFEVSHVKSSFSSDLKFSNRSLANVEPGSDRYRMVLPIAAAVSDIMDVATIYKLPGKVIISLVDEQINQFMEDAIGMSTQHILYRSTKDIAPLVEGLMHDEEILFVGENGLLNDALSETVLWQLELIENIKRCGIKIVNISFEEMYRNRQKTLAKAASQICPEPLIREKVREATLFAETA